MPKGTSTNLSNPLFLITLLVIISFAVVVDTIDLFMEFMGVGFVNPGFGLTIKTSISKSILTAMDIGTSVIIGGWTYWFQKQGVSRKKEEDSKKSPSEKEKAAKGKGNKTAGKVGAKTGKRIGLKAGAITGLTLVGELIPFVGAAPFWTLTVLITFINVIKGK